MIVIGAKGFAKKLLQIFSELKILEELCFFDNVSSDLPNKLYGKFNIIRSFPELQELILKDPQYILGVGGSLVRFELARKVNELGGVMQKAISSSASIAPFDVTIENGVAVLSHAIVECGVHIGEGTLINNAAIISHDSSIGKYCVVSPAATILGRASIDDFSEIGSNAVILPDVHIGRHCKIGAGAVVTKNVHDSTTVVGVPAKPLKRSEETSEK